ncbi:MAG: hypothetical protein WCK32_06210 [Chlorobiaceae bacterium]
MQQLIELSINESGALQLIVSNLLIAGLVGISLIIILVRWFYVHKLRTTFEINEAEIGIGSGKIKFRPNREDLQIAYQLWVELKTRKLGIKVDENNDVIHEVYNSWYEFFGITRQLVKSIPAIKVRSSEDTRALVVLAMKVLNQGLRPHLTTWQAKYRRWYDQESQNDANKQLPPQVIQKNYKEYSSLIAEMQRVNLMLVKYAELLESMIYGKE